MENIINAYLEMRLVFNLIAVALFLFSLVTMWKVYTKAGEGGWKILIPIYNTYIQFKIANAKKRFWLSLLLVLGGGVFLATFIGDILWDMQLVGGFFVDYYMDKLLVVLAVLLVILLINITVNFSMAKAFGLPAIFGLGLMLLPIIFYAIIAFNGNIEYVNSSARHKGRFVK